MDKLLNAVSAEDKHNMQESGLSKEEFDKKQEA